MIRETPAGLLVGREGELQAIEGLLAGVRESGATLIVRGDAGIGKSALMAAARSRATNNGMLVLSTAGVQSETDLPFAGLHQLLRKHLCQRTMRGVALTENARRPRPRRWDRRRPP